MKGRAAALQRDVGTCSREFETGLNLLSGHPETFRYKAHLQVRYAEHMALLDDWSSAVSIAQSFLEEATTNRFKSHLVLRTLLLLLEAPSTSLTDSQLAVLRLRVKLHVWTMGLTQSVITYPLLSRVANRIGSFDEFSAIDERNELRSLILRLSDVQMEEAIKSYFEILGYHVFKFGDAEPALDLLAWKESEGRNTDIAWVQVKHFTSKAVAMKDMPNLLNFTHVQETIQNTPAVPKEAPSELVWYCTTGIRHDALALLRTTASALFQPPCSVRVINLNDLLDDLMGAHSDQLPAFVFQFTAGSPRT